MIEIQNLNDTSLESILEDAKKQILYQSTEWTNFQESDPGITLVELFSWLKFVQHEYLNRISVGVEKKFLKLLDVSMYKNKGSETLLEVSGLKDNVNLPLRTKWKFNNMIFENLNSQVLIKSKILSVVFENPEFPSQEEYYKFDGKKAFFLFGKDIGRKNDKNEKRRFTINFDSSLPKQSIVNFYFSVYVSKGLERNPINSSDKFEEMAKVKWEYYGKEKGKVGWHKVEIVNDNTHNFLFSGIIKMRFNGDTLPLDGEYKVRAVLEYDEYDYPPRIDNLLTNVFIVAQNDTVCENFIIKKEDISASHVVKLSSNLALYGKNDIYFKKNGGWIKSELPVFKQNIKRGETIVNLSGMWHEIKALKHNEEAVMIVSYEKTLEDKMVLGSGTGISHQGLEVSFKDILNDGLELMISEQVDGEEVFYKWEGVDDFFSSSKYDRHYILDKNLNAILFGDHERGMAPRVGTNNIKICSLRRTFGRESNIKEGMINAVVSENKIVNNCLIRQIIPATGGINEENLLHAQARSAEIFSNPQRAVTVNDYENIVRSTPGLMFSNVKVLPNYMPGEDLMKQNCITIAVRWNRKVGLTLPESFRKNIINHLEKYRIINTKIKIVSPEYIGLIISGVITVDSSYRESDQYIEEEVKTFIKNINNDLGQPLKFGDLFGMIDRLKYVSSLNKLRITAIGNNAQKNVSEDIIIPPNGVYYVQKIDFSYVKSSEIYRS